MGAPSDDFSLWLLAARSGSTDALGQALETCRRYLLEVARNELGARLQAKVGLSDLVQDTFLEAQRAFRGFQGDSEIELRAWLCRLLQHQASKLRRRYRTTQKRCLARETALPAVSPSGGEFEVRAELPTPSTQLMAQEQAQQLCQALERLPDDYRQVVRLRYIERLSFEDIGRLMDRSANAARLLWLRAIERVKHEIEGCNER